MKQIQKTNAMRLLDQKKINYEMIEVENAEGLSGVEMALKANEDKDRVFKTLVTIGASNTHYVFVIPVALSLNLKKAAKIVGEKNIAMIPQKELLPLTGYVHGGCSPLGMKKFFKTVIDETALLDEYMLFSGGRIGLQIKMNSKDIEKVIDIEFGDVSD